MTAPRPAIEVAGLTLASVGKTLLENTGFTVLPGEICLLVGLSGSGKSLTLKLLLGLIESGTPGLSVAGKMLLFGEDARVAARRRAGIVFQDFGLFDEWSVRENIAFGYDHKPGADPAKRSAVVDQLLREFRLEGAGPVALLSGGMKQRTALARTLAYDPEIIFYDEPTSGLDPAMAAQVAARIKKTNDEHKKTSIVVTHDLFALAEIADRIILIDPVAKAFREVEKSRIAHDLHAVAENAASVPPGPAAMPDVVARIMRSGTAFFSATGAALEAAFVAAFALLPRFPRLKWGARYFWYFLGLSTFGSAIGYVFLAGFVLGVIVTYFAYNYLPFRAYTEPLVLDSLTGAIGYAVYRIMAPGMTSMLIAARSGAACAADIGNRVYSRQTDALRSFGVPPNRYFLTNSLWAHLVGTPLLVAVNFIAASIGSLTVFTLVHPEQSTFFWSDEYFRLLRRGVPFFEGTPGVLWKSLVSAFGTAAIAHFYGMRAKPSGRDVSHAVTRTIIASTLFVLLVHLVAALIEFRAAG